MTRFVTAIGLLAVALSAGAVAQPAPHLGGFVVFFDLDRAGLTPDMALILDNAAAAFHQSGEAQVILTGFADRAGSAAAVGPASAVGAATATSAKLNALPSIDWPLKLPSHTPLTV